MMMPSEEGILELPGGDPMRIWAFTCPTPGCRCRTAVVLSTLGDRDALITQGAPVRDAWLRGDSYATAAAELSGVIAFALDIDGGRVFPVDGDSPTAPFDFDAQPHARAVVDRIDGEVLDAIGRLWYRGKGWRDPEEKSRDLAQIKIEDWRPGELVAWSEALVGVREDLFRFDKHLYEAIDLYCVAENCDCGEVILDFAPVSPRGAPPPGAVRVGRSGEATLQPEHERHRERLAQLWTAFRNRHPRCAARFARRSADMQAIAGRIIGAPRSAIARRTAKIGRNDPCPCRSGKKYKTCCGAT